MAQKNEATRSAKASQWASHGRGGAGNMLDSSQSPKLNASDLATPVLKKPVVTTGRGGTGNMAKNDDPLATRLRQDVRAVPRRYSSGAQYSGRGGAGNVFREDEDLCELARKGSRDQVVDEGPDAESALNKRRNWLFGRKN
ncbi:hypothetical protein ED733_005241 [Metarhizium rileyi]|uniref:Uncharacterized protein n=1 Tax=Metarhizium rileyi (strain RCEF 4871) TaxID=1649241 RepID=A0A5C6GCI3_METRR|nr:hypothetical protein ED733_005241 [Metarhizium rileyi]